MGNQITIDQMSILQQGVLVIDTNWNQTTDYCSTTPIPSKYDTTPSTLLFLNACIGVFWWIASMFIYNKNNIDLTDNAGRTTVPLLWWWSHLGNHFHGWTAAMYFTNFFVLILTSVIEFCSYFLFLQGRNRWFAVWTSTIGWWGAIVGQAVPWIFALFQLTFDMDKGGLANRD